MLAFKTREILLLRLLLLLLLLLRIAEYARCNGRVLHDGIRDDVGCGTRLGSCLLHGRLIFTVASGQRDTREILLLVSFVRINDSHTACV